MTTFYLIRHGEPDWELLDKYHFKGHGCDLAPLTERGRNQVESTAKDERLRHCELIVSSPYTRAIQTAAILSKELGLPIQVEMDLREWQPDLTYEYDSVDTLAELTSDYEKHQGVYPSGQNKLWEPTKELKTRVEKVIERYLHYSRVIVVGHGMAFRTLVHVEDIPHASMIEYNP